MVKSFFSFSSKETKKIAQELAKEIILKKRKRKTAFLILLEGDLGAGKTTFLQGFAKGLGIKKRVLSPTFVIIRKFKIPKRKYFKNLYHIDCFRIKTKKEILALGLKEIISNPQNIIAIEWPEILKKILPKERIEIKFKFLNKEKRKIIINFKI